jgi:hypothetical protein
MQSALLLLAAITLTGCVGRLEGHQILGEAMNNEDAGLPPRDASVGDVDAGVPRDDAGSAPSDSGTPIIDAGFDMGTTAGVDAGRDSGVPDLGGDAGSPVTGGDCDNPLEQEELRLTNIARAEVGASPLVCDPLLTAVARAHSRDMCELGYFDHTSLDGRSPFDRMHDAGVSYTNAGENIAAGQDTPADVNDAWLNSPGHYANIINTRYGKIGIGYHACPGGEYNPYWTQNFTN